MQTVPSYVEHNVNMVVLHGQRFHLVFLGHIHHFGPDPCGWRELYINDDMLCIEINNKKKLKNKKRLLFVMLAERYSYHWVQVLDKMALKGKLPNKLKDVFEVMESWHDSIVWWINY